MKLRSRSVEDTRGIGEALAALLRAGDMVVLGGDLGTGKTALAQGIGRGLGIEEQVVSPSFVIVREYEGRLPMTHVDVYRLDRLQELHDLGFEEVVDDARVTVVEWGDRVMPLLSEGRLEISLRVGASSDEREIECVGLGREWASREVALETALARWAGGDAC